MAKSGSFVNSNKNKIIFTSCIPCFNNWIFNNKKATVLDCTYNIDCICYTVPMYFYFLYLY